MVGKGIERRKRKSHFYLNAKSYFSVNDENKKFLCDDFLEIRNVLPDAEKINNPRFERNSCFKN